MYIIIIDISGKEQHGYSFYLRKGEDIYFYDREGIHAGRCGASEICNYPAKNENSRGSKRIASGDGKRKTRHILESL